MDTLLLIQRWLYEGVASGLRSVDGPSTLAWAAATAVLFGAVHALMPGHGKTALVSYYVGRPARMLGGVGASAVLILTHVGSAVLLVLAGFAAIRATLGGVGRAPAFEAASAVLVVVVGTWLLVRALRHTHAPEGSSGMVAFAAGLVPCPLTTFIMVYSLANGVVLAGLLVSGAMALGMVATVFVFVACTILLRDRALGFLGRTAPTRERIGRALETLSAVLVIAFGLWLFATRAV